MDPHCGWCYGNSDNMDKLSKEFKNSIEIEILVGGMWLGSNAPKGGIHLSQFISEHSPRMEQVTGAHVGTSFFKLTKDKTYTFSSLEPSCAIVLVKELYSEKVMNFVKEVQKAIFIEGKRLDKIEAYLEILKQVDIETTYFEKYWMTEINISNAKSEFVRAKNIATGYPSLFLQSDSKFDLIASGFFNAEVAVQKIKAVVR